MVKLLLPAVFFLSINVFGQSSVSKVFIKGDFYNKPLLQFIKELEAKHDVQFHYVNDVVDGVTLNGILKNNTPLMEALDILLQDKPISFALDGEGQVVLFRNVKKATKEIQKLFALSGVITDKISGLPLPFVSIQIPGTLKGAVSDDAGKFEIKPLPEGIHLVHFSFVGYHTIIRKISIDDNTFVQVAMEENVMQLKELIITPSMFEISTIESTALTLGKEEVLHSPNMGKDIYRTLRALPGIANTDYSSKARIRGGHSDETAVYLDHFLINDAFHLEEVDGSFSIFNTDYVDELTVLTGGFSAKYTDRLSGIIDVKTFDHLEADKYRISADLLNLSLFAQKRLSNKTNLSFTGRRGYLDFLLRKMGTEDTDALDPRFSDFWAKITHKANKKNAFSFNVLIGRDNFQLADMDEYVAQLKVQNIRNNINAWANWKWFPSKNFSSVTTLGYQVMQRRADFVFPDNLEFGNIDENGTGILVLTNNSYWDVSEHGAIETGVELKQYNSDFRYKELRYDLFNSTPDNVIVHDINIDKKIDGSTGAAYAQYNWTINKDLILQPGIRASYQSFSPSLKWAPRFAASYAITPSINARVAWGIYYQPDLYFRLRTPLYQEEPYDKNSKSIHYTGSLTYSASRTNVMLNVYHKEYDYLFDDYRFEFFNRMGGINILDVLFNTHSGYASGVEIMVRQNYGSNSTLSLSYAYAKSRIRNLSGDETYRDFDQPHTVIINNIFRLPKDWNISLLWTYHTGYPYTPTEVDFIHYRPNTEGIVLFYETGIKNSQRLPSHHSLDLRMEKSWRFRKNILCAYLNIVNFYGRDNTRSYYWYPVRLRNGTIFFERETQVNIPFFVSPGISFTLY